MNKKYLISGLIVIGFLALYLAGCGPKIEKFGEAPDETQVKTAIATLLVNPQNYQDKEVVVEGVISSECPTGGWIRVNENSGASIYVEMHGSSFAPIPQRVGKKVLVKGTVYQSEGSDKEIKLLGKGLVIR
ncbi:MAG: hypothetical protein V1739_09155 [Candidatus Omnitrophota bacterium]